MNMVCAFEKKNKLLCGREIILNFALQTICGSLIVGFSGWCARHFGIAYLLDALS